MIPHLFYYQLVVLGLLWLCVMLHAVWPSRDARAQPQPAEVAPIKPKRTRSHEPQPFAGLTHKPPCALVCARSRASPRATAGATRADAPNPPPPSHGGHL